MEPITSHSNTALPIDLQILHQTSTSFNHCHALLIQTGEKLYLGKVECLKFLSSVYFEFAVTCALPPTIPNANYRVKVVSTATLEDLIDPRLNSNIST